MQDFGRNRYPGVRSWKQRGCGRVFFYDVGKEFGAENYVVLLGKKIGEA